MSIERNKGYKEDCRRYLLKFQNSQVKYYLTFYPAGEYKQNVLAFVLKTQKGNPVGIGNGPAAVTG